MEFRCQSTSGELEPPSLPAASHVMIPVICVYTLKTSFPLLLDHGYTTAVEALAHVGYIACSPEQPQLAVSIATLQLYHYLRLRQPSFSTESFARVICDMYQRPYQRRIRDALAAAFEIFIRANRLIDKEIKALCEWDAENWRVQHACPACCYEVSEIKQACKASFLLCIARRRATSQVSSNGCHGWQQLLEAD